MSLTRDFGMYFENTVVGILGSNGEVNPFVIARMDEPTRAQGRESLRFMGEEVTNSEGRTEAKVVGFSDLIFELPEIGYIEISGTYHWISYCQRKTVKKGICQNRINNRDLPWSNRLYWKFYHPECPGRLHKDFAREGNEVKYKGLSIGTISGEVLTIPPSAEFLSTRLAEVTGCRLVVASTT